MIYLRIKLGLMFVGAPLALASGPLGRRWLFFLGIALLVVALVLPARPGETLSDKLSAVVRHLPGSNWLKSKDRTGD